MKLSKKDKEYLLSIGVPRKDFKQIEEVSKRKYTKIVMFTKEDESIAIPITQKKAIEIIGRKMFLNALNRSTFHWSAVRYNEEGTIFVSFDSSKYYNTIFKL